MASLFDIARGWRARARTGYVFLHTLRLQGEGRAQRARGGVCGLTACAAHVAHLPPPDIAALADLPRWQGEVKGSVTPSRICRG